jgi:hypothetical protein
MDICQLPSVDDVYEGTRSLFDVVADCEMYRLGLGEQNLIRKDDLAAALQSQNRPLLRPASDGLNITCGQIVVEELAGHQHPVRGNERGEHRHHDANATEQYAGA